MINWKTPQWVPAFNIGLQLLDSFHCSLPEPRESAVCLTDLKLKMASHVN